MNHRKARIRLFNVKFSPNLGDGLLSECLEQAIRDCGGDAGGTFSVDLSARTAYERGAPSRSLVLKVLANLPGPLRPVATAIPREILLRRKWRPHYERHLENADAVVIGGGNLFTDMDLNFPIKVAGVLDLAHRRRLPAAIYGVGVSSHWSPKGTRIVRDALALARPVYVSVRDENSKRSFDRLFAEAAGREALVVRDPGLMIARYARTATSRSRIGLCVTSSIAIRYHSAETVTDAQMATWYANLCELLARRGHAVTVFTNGSPEDEIVLDSIEGALRAKSSAGFERGRPASPTELAGLIGSLSGLIAHRMHAIIAGVSFGVPVYALLWDEKLKAFMGSIGETDAMAHARPGNEAEVAEGLERRLARPPRKTTQELVDETYAGVRELFRLLAA